MYVCVHIVQFAYTLQKYLFFLQVTVGMSQTFAACGEFKSNVVDHSQWNMTNPSRQVFIFLTVLTLHPD